MTSEAERLLELERRAGITAEKEAEAQAEQQRLAAEHRRMAPKIAHARRVNELADVAAGVRHIRARVQAIITAATNEGGLSAEELLLLGDAVGDLDSIETAVTMVGGG